MIGKLGVVLFFVLSGFLITYLLLDEINLTTKINMKNFYIRRILRIFPLYYLILIFSFFILPNFTFFSFPDKPISFENFPLKQLILYFTMFPNLAAANFSSIPFASQSWSIGTEEQFYLIWPIIFILFPKRKIQMIILTIIIYLIIKFFLKNNNTFLYNFWMLFNIDCMAIGGVIAYIKFNNLPILKYLINTRTFILTLIFLLMLILFGINFGFFHYEIYASLFSILILNLACNKNISNLLEFKILDYLGKISYGLYMYHVIAIFIIIKITNNSLLIYLFSILSTIIIAHISYNYFEKPFLKMKKKF